ncbi:MAG: hypothetical protein K6E62_06680 [Lachnospiraceae bacterium]|nr:hypothetical protein [Lachnospiraceae bacterium]
MSSSKNMQQIKDDNAPVKSERIIGCLAAMGAHLIEQDFISSYIPFVATVLLKESNSTTDNKVEVSILLKRFAEDYGFEIDRAPMVSILNKCVRKGIVVRSKHGNYTVIEDKCREVAISDTEVLREGAKYQKVVSSLCEFYRDRYNIKDITESQVEEKLLLFFNKHSAKTLRFDFKDDYNQTDQKLRDISHYYIISQFILDKKKHNDDVFPLIQHLALAFLMSSCIAYTEDRDDRSQIDAFKNLHVYVDTPWLLKIMGANEDEMQEAEQELLKRIRQLKGNFHIFRHTYDEALFILNDCIHWIDNPECDVTYASNALRSFIRRRFTKDDVIEFVDTFDYKLKSNGIEIDDGDYATGRYYSTPIDEGTIIQTIEDTYKEFDPNKRNYAKQKTIENDAKSIAYVLRKWDNRRASTYRQAKFVFVTTNESLAYAVRRLPKNYNYNQINHVYPCITNVYLGTNIWLSAPVKTIETFSLKKLISDCMTQLEPTEKLIFALQKSIEKYYKNEPVSQERLYLLKTKAFSNDYLMNTTLGDEKNFNDSICEELIENLEAEIRQPLLYENDRLSSSLKNYRNKEKKIKEIIDKCDYRASRIVKIVKNSALSAILICVVSFLINSSGALKIPNGIVLILSVILLISALIEVVLRFWDRKIQSILARILRMGSRELDELQTENIKNEQFEIAEEEYKLTIQKKTEE